MHLNKYFSLFTLAILVSFGLNAQAFFTEDFSDDLAGWTTEEVVGNGTPTAVWFWSDVGPTGPFEINPLESTTADNGFAIFDSDLNCNIGVGQDSWLISPVINASDKTVVWLEFQTYFRSFFDMPQIRVGTDLGDLSSWEAIEVFPGITNNQFGGIIDQDESLNPQTVRINLSDLMAGESAVYFAFQFLSTADEGGGTANYGCAYSWQVDDVLLTETDFTVQNDMRVNSWHALSPNIRVPVSQIEPIGFMADIENVGAQDQDDVVLTVTVMGPDGQMVYQDSVEYGTIAADSLAENVFFPSEFTPTAGELGVYTGSYTLTYANQEAEEVPGNNQIDFAFEVTENEFAKEIDFNVAFSGLDDSYTYGNIFYINNSDENDPFLADNITFAINNADDLAGETVITFLYEWEGDTNDNGDADQDEYTTAGFSSYTFDGTETQEFITVPANEDGPVALQEDMYYIAAVQYSSNVEGQTVSFLASDVIDYSGTFFYTDSLERPRYTYAIDNGNEGSLGYGFDIAPVVRLSITDVVGIQEVRLPQGAVQLYPNPVSETALLDFQLETAVDVKATVFNTKGQIVRTQNWDSIEAQQVQLPVQTLPNGTYFVRIDSELGVRTLKMIVQH